MSSTFLSDPLVLDCASFIDGPLAATILSDFGARVIKIEPPGLGDAYLQSDPPLRGNAAFQTTSDHGRSWQKNLAIQF